jgi:osmotically-inducible protein OsmY
MKVMKLKIAGLVVVGMLGLVSAGLQSGCAVGQGRETSRAYMDDKVIASRIKTALYSDPTVKGTEVSVISLNGVVQLSGFVDNQTARDRAGQIATDTPGVTKVYNNLLLPTGR